MSPKSVTVSIAVTVATFALLSGCKKKERKDAPATSPAASAPASPAASPTAVSPAPSEAAKPETTTVAGGFDPTAESLPTEHQALAAALTNLFWPGTDDGLLHGEAYFGANLKVTSLAAAGPTSATISDGKKLDEQLEAVLEAAKASKQTCNPADSCCTFQYDHAANPLPAGSTLVHKVCFNMTGKEPTITELEIGPLP